MGLQVGGIGLKTLLISRLRDSNYTLDRKLCKNNSLDSGFLLSENYHMPTVNRILCVLLVMVSLQFRYTSKTQK